MTDLRVGCRCYGNGRFQDPRPLFFDMRVLYNYNNLRARRKGASGLEVHPRLGGLCRL
jgi:hypothetical protein